MAAQLRDKDTPRRTKDHQIADLSVNHVERLFLEMGHVPLGIPKDYGYDLTVTTHNSRGFAESGLIYLQLKATRRLKLARKTTGYKFSIERKHYNQWRLEPLPVFLIRYCARTKTAFYLYLQPYFHANPKLFKPAATSATILIPRANALDANAVQYMHGRKADILRQLNKKVVHVA
jgi:hypothetical protein